MPEPRRPHYYDVELAAQRQLKEGRPHPGGGGVGCGGYLLLAFLVLMVLGAIGGQVVLVLIYAGVIQ